MSPVTVGCGQRLAYSVVPSSTSTSHGWAPRLRSPMLFDTVRSCHPLFAESWYSSPAQVALNEYVPLVGGVASVLARQVVGLPLKRASVVSSNETSPSG